jgi:hypothetical protein
VKEVHPSVALLAPVPLGHLESGLEVCSGQGKVAFGSRAWEVFRELDAVRVGLQVDVYIYASWAGPQEVRAASWRAVYVGHVVSVGGGHPDGMRFRPPTTEQNESDNAGHWAVFWEVRDLRRLDAEQFLPTGQFTGRGKKRAYRDNFAPEGPLLVEHP